MKRCLLAIFSPVLCLIFLSKIFLSKPPFVISG